MVALNENFAPEKPALGSKNRVGNFFGGVAACTGENRPATRNRIGEKRPTLTITASGRPGVPRPQGPFRLVEGAEYDAARSAANRANNQIRIDSNLRGQPVDVHEISPVKFNGSPTDPANKIILDRNLHRQQVTPWWNQLQRDIGG